MAISDGQFLGGIAVGGRETGNGSGKNGLQRVDIIQWRVGLLHVLIDGCVVQVSPEITKRFKPSAAQRERASSRAYWVLPNREHPRLAPPPCLGLQGAYGASSSCSIRSPKNTAQRLHTWIYTTLCISASIRSLISYRTDPHRNPQISTAAGPWISQQSQKPPDSSLEYSFHNRPRPRRSRPRPRPRRRPRSRGTIAPRRSSRSIARRIGTILKDRPAIAPRVRCPRQRDKRARDLRLPIHIKVLGRRRTAQPRRAHEGSQVEIGPVVAARETAVRRRNRKVGRLLERVDDVPVRRRCVRRCRRAVAHKVGTPRGRRWRECPYAAPATVVGRLGDVGRQPVQDEPPTGVLGRRGIRVDHDDEVVARVSRDGLVQRRVDRELGLGLGDVAAKEHRLLHRRRVAVEAVPDAQLRMVAAIREAEDGRWNRLDDCWGVYCCC